MHELLGDGLGEGVGVGAIAGAKQPSRHFIAVQHIRRKGVQQIQGPGGRVGWERVVSLLRRSWRRVDLLCCVAPGECQLGKEGVHAPVTVGVGSGDMDQGL